MAHVRAATPGSEVNLANCHPFEYGSYLLMHNGRIGGFPAVRRRLLESLTDEAFDVVRGSTDTEHLFAVFVDEIDPQRMPVDPAEARRPRADPRSRWRASRRALRGAPPRRASWPRRVELPERGGLRRTHAAISRFTDDTRKLPESLYYLTGSSTSRPGGFPQRRVGDEGQASWCPRSGSPTSRAGGWCPRGRYWPWTATARRSSWASTSRWRRRRRAGGPRRRDPHPGGSAPEQDAPPCSKTMSRGMPRPSSFSSSAWRSAGTTPFSAMSWVTPA